MSHISAPRARDVNVDLYKALLMLMMIFSHTIGIFGSRNLPVLGNVKYLIELVAFPGFLLCFGYNTQLAYFSTRPLNYRRIGRTAARLLIAFYISAICYEIFLDENGLSWNELGQILTLSRIPYVSEFMLNFPLTLLIATVLVKPIGWVLETRLRLLITIGLLLATTFFPYQIVTAAQLGLLIGTPRTVFYSYPVVQYFPIFLIGMYFARHQIHYSRWVMAGSLVAVGSALIIFQMVGVPLRFPPAFGWIVASIAFALSGYFLVQYLPTRSRTTQWLMPIGVNTLNFFLLSNIFLFALRSKFPTVVASPVACVLLTLVVSGVIYFITQNAHRAPKLWPEKTPLAEAARLPLSSMQAEVLHGLNRGAVLKVERDMDGRKDFILNTVDGSACRVPREVVEPLIEHNFIDSNKKFPAATFWLTTAGRAQLD